MSWSWIAILLCTVLTEVSWVLAVRIVSANQTWRFVAIAIGMQGVSYVNTLIAVDDHLAMIPGMLGAGLGALIGMRVPASWLRKDAPTGP